MKGSPSSSSSAPRTSNSGAPPSAEIRQIDPDWTKTIVPSAPRTPARNRRGAAERHGSASRRRNLHEVALREERDRVAIGGKERRRRARPDRGARNRSRDEIVEDANVNLPVGGVHNPAAVARDGQALPEILISPQRVREPADGRAGGRLGLEEHTVAAPAATARARAPIQRSLGTGPAGLAAGCVEVSSSKSHASPTSAIVVSDPSRDTGGSGRPTGGGTRLNPVGP